MKREKKSNSPDSNKPYVIRNFFKELRRINWPTKKKNYYYFLWTIIFIILLVIVFALISLGANKFIELIGAK